MIIECTSCHSRYQYDEDRFERKPSKKIRCAKCGQIFEIHNPAFAPKQAPAVGDSTYTRREETHASAPMPKMDEATTEAALPSTQKVEPALPAGKRISLAIIDGPDAGSVYRVEKPRMTIGRSGADLTLNDSEASRQHAQLEIRDTIYMVSDLGSTNGTLINGQKIDDATELQDKSEFQVGATTLMLIVTDEA